LYDALVFLAAGLGERKLRVEQGTLRIKDLQVRGNAAAGSA